MRVFVTGASGHMGSAVLPELSSAGHQVTGLARSDAAAATIEKLGGQVVRGDLSDLDVLAEASAAADGVIHLAFRHDLMAVGDLATAGAIDLAALKAIGAALGDGKPLVGTSGTAVVALVAGSERPASEDMRLPGGYRADAENFVLGLEGVRSSVVRLTPTVHSDLDLHGFVPGVIAAARRNGFAAYVGDGSNVWPAVHTRDAAHLYRLALESAPAGSLLHAVADEGVPFAEIAAAIGRNLGIPVRGIGADEAGAFFGFLATFVQVHNPASSALTRNLLSWEPTRPGLIADLDEGHYFRG